MDTFLYEHFCKVLPQKFYTHLLPLHYPTSELHLAEQNHLKKQQPTPRIIQLKK